MTAAAGLHEHPMSSMTCPRKCHALSGILWTWVSHVLLCGAHFSAGSVCQTTQFSKTQRLLFSFHCLIFTPGQFHAWRCLFQMTKQRRKLRTLWSFSFHLHLWQGQDLLVSRYRMSSIDDILGLFEVMTLGIKFGDLNCHYTLK